MSETLDPDPNATATGLVVGLYRPRYESLPVPHAVYVDLQIRAGLPTAVSATFRCIGTLPPNAPDLVLHISSPTIKGRKRVLRWTFSGGNMTRVSEGGGEKNNKSRCPSGVALKVTQCGRGSFSLGKEKSGHSGFGTSCCDPKNRIRENHNMDS